MKYLLSLLMLTLSGCGYLLGPTFETALKVDSSTLKFHAGDKVTTSNGFYSSCVGTVEGYNDYYEKALGPTYNILFSCPNFDRKEPVNVSEKYLTKSGK